MLICWTHIDHVHTHWHIFWESLLIVFNISQSECHCLRLPTFLFLLGAKMSFWFWPRKEYSVRDNWCALESMKKWPLYFAEIKLNGSTCYRSVPLFAHLQSKRFNANLRLYYLYAIPMLWVHPFILFVFVSGCNDKIKNSNAIYLCINMQLPLIQPYIILEILRTFNQCENVCVSRFVEFLFSFFFRRDWVFSNNSHKLF